MAFLSRPRVVLVGLVGLGTLGMVANSARGPQVAVAPVEKRPLVQTVVSTGRVDVPAKVQIGSLLLGTVASVRAEEGQHVKKGQLLVELNDQELHAAVQQARAQVQAARVRAEQVQALRGPAAAQEFKQAELNLSQAQSDYERRHELFQKGAITRAELDQASTALEVARSRSQSAELNALNTSTTGTEGRLAQAALAQADAALQQATARLSQSLMAAPADGTVLARHVEPGDVVQPGKVLLVLARDGDTRVLVPFDEKNLAFLRLGQEALASADAFPQERFKASVEWIAPAIDAQRGTVDVKLRVPEPPAFLRADMTVSVEVEVGRRESTVVVPSGAVRDTTSRAPFVWTVVDGRAEKRPVQLGLRGEGLVEVLQGLNAGDALVVEPGSALVDGKRVRVSGEGA